MCSINIEAEHPWVLADSHSVCLLIVPKRPVVAVWHHMLKPSKSKLLQLECMSLLNASYNKAIVCRCVLCDDVCKFVLHVRVRVE